MLCFDLEIVGRRALLGASLALIGLSSCSAAEATWNDSDLVQPKELAQRLSRNDKEKLVILHVGFPVLYRGKHLPDAILAGPGNTPAGMENLKKVVSGMSKSRDIIIYCGCCPWANCPNMKPSFALLKQLGFKRVKALVIETNFSKDWIQMGYPVQNGKTAA